MADSYTSPSITDLGSFAEITLAKTTISTGIGKVHGSGDTIMIAGVNHNPSLGISITLGTS